MTSLQTLPVTRTPLDQFLQARYGSMGMQLGGSVPAYAPMQPLMGPQPTAIGMASSGGLDTSYDRVVELMAQQQQYNNAADYALNASYMGNIGQIGPGSTATVLMNPQQLEAASTELDMQAFKIEDQKALWTDQSVQLLQELAQQYPDLSAGVLGSMALAGLGPGVPGFDEIIQSDADRQFSDRLQGLQPGQQVSPAQVLATERQQAEPDFWQRTAVGRGIKGAVRTALAVPMGAAEAFSAGVTSATQEALTGKDAGGTLEQLGEDGGGGPLAELIRGAVHEDEDVQLGSGWFPMQGGMVTDPEAEGQMISEGQRVTHDLLSFQGRFLTPGRSAIELVNDATRSWFGANVIEPGTRPYNTVSWAADTAYQLAGLNPGNMIDNIPWAVHRARTAGFAGSRPEALRQGVIEAMGGVRGTRKTVDGDTAREWLDSPDGNRFAEWVARERSVTTLMSKKGIDVQTARQLADETNPAAIKDVLRPLMGTPITMAPRPGAQFVGAGGKIERRYRSGNIFSRNLPRIAGERPTTMLKNPGDLTEVYHQMQPVMRNARFTFDEIETFNRRLSELPERNPSAVESLLRTHFDDVAKNHIMEHGVDQAVAHQAVRRYRKSTEAERLWWADEAGRSRRVTGAQQNVAIDGSITYSPSPLMLGEYLNSAIPLPDPAEVKALTAMPGVRQLVQSDTYQGASHALDKLNSMWKAAVLPRIAYILRVGGAEQARMGAAGMDSLLSDPASAMMWIIGKRGDEINLGGDEVWHLSDLKERAAAMNRSTADWRRGRDGAMAHGNWRAADVNDPQFNDNWLNEFQIAAEDPVVRHYLKYGFDDTVDWLWDGEGQAHRLALMTSDAKKTALSRRGLDSSDPDYVDSVEGYVETIQDVTNQVTGNGDPELLDGLRSGKLADVVIPGVHWNPAQRTALKNKLTEKAAAGSHPAFVRKFDDPAALKAERRTLLDRIMDFAMVKPTNFLARSPAFNQSWWNSMLRQAGDMDSATLQKLKIAARNSRMKRDYLDALDKARGQGQITDFDAADLVARSEAIDETKNLLYDPTRRGNLSQTVRHIAPFAEAWKEEWTVWSKLLRKDPLRTPHRLNQGWQFLRQSNPLDIVTGEDPSEGKGFFFQNEQGEEVYTSIMPFLRSHGEVQVGAESPVKSLSMVANNLLFPGLGPAATVVASYVTDLLPADGWGDWVRDIVNKEILPYGTADTSGETTLGALETAVPAWMRDLYTAAMADTQNPDRNPKFASLTGQVMRSMLMSGEALPPQNDAEMETLITDAATAARGIMLSRAIGKFVMPSSPREQLQIADEYGEVWETNLIGNYYQKLEDSFGEDVATALITQQFGTESLAGLFYSQSSEIQPRGLATSDWDWQQRNEALFEKYPNAAFHLTPLKDAGGFSFDALNAAKETGARTQLPLSLAARKTNDALGAMMFRRFKTMADDIFGGTDSLEKQLWLRQQEVSIRRSLAGYDDGTGFQTIDPEAELRYVEQMLGDEKALAAISGGDPKLIDAARELIDIHTEANQYAASVGRANYYGAADMGPVRDWVRSQIQAVLLDAPQAQSIAELMEYLMGRSDDPTLNNLVTYGDEAPDDQQQFGQLGPLAGMGPQVGQMFAPPQPVEAAPASAYLGMG